MSHILGHRPGWDNRDNKDKQTGTVGNISTTIKLVAIEEAVGLAHPHGLLIVGCSGAGAFVKGDQLTVTAVGKIAVSVSGTASLIYTIGLNSIPSLTVG
jgi:translation initiation factor 2 gamma subunit (eIF-2gamma)